MDAVVAGQIAMVVTVLVGIVVLVWQGIVQGSKYDTLNQRLDGMYQHFDSKFDAQSKLIADTAQRLEDKMDAQIQRSEANTRALLEQSEANAKAQLERSEANAKAQLEQSERSHREDVRRLEAMTQVLGQRLSESEREQARLEGVNSVLRHQMHQHESSPSD